MFLKVAFRKLPTGFGSIPNSSMQPTAIMSGPIAFDRKTADIFKLQDEIIENIVRKLALKINQTERERVFSKHTDNLEAYDYFAESLSPSLSKKA